MTKIRSYPKEFKVVSLRECPTPEAMLVCDTPAKAAEYWNLHIKTAAHFNPDCECLVILMVNTKLRVKGHHVVSSGILDNTLVHAREVFRTAVVASAFGIVVMHNHPSGDPTPSQDDIKITRELIRAGEILRVNVLDHVIVGQDKHVSLKELGFL